MCLRPPPGLIVDGVVYVIRGFLIRLIVAATGIAILFALASFSGAGALFSTPLAALTAGEAIGVVWLCLLGEMLFCGAILALFEEPNPTSYGRAGRASRFLRDSMWAARLS